MTRTWSEGVCGDGAAILCDGELVPISELIVHLNRCEFIRSAALEEAAKVADAEKAARNLNRAAALCGSREWGADTQAAAMAQGHKALTAGDIASAIRALKDKPNE